MSLQRYAFKLKLILKTDETRKHSSRMRAVRCSDRLGRGCTCEGCTCEGCTCEGVYLWGEMYLGGGVPASGVYLPDGVYLPGGVPAQGYTCQRGEVRARGCVSQLALRQTSPYEQNEKHYLAATSLRTVNILDNTKIVMNK